MHVRMFASSVVIENESETEPQDIIDAIETLEPKKKLTVSLSPPGQGPDFFLNWANEELKEANGTSDEPTKLRKYYNAAVYAKGAVECLVDWYLAKQLLSFTISPFAGTAQKFEALDSENLLGISFSLFNDIVFEPRNRGIHKFELVEEKEARHGYELARLTIKNCVHHVSPSEAASFYGNIVAYKGKEALKQLGRDTDVADAFYFAGIGESGEYAVLFNRSHKDGKISILPVLDGGRIQSRYCTIRGKFSSNQIRAIFSLLERSKPEVITGFDEDDLRNILDLLLPERRQRPTDRSAGRARQHRAS